MSTVDAPIRAEVPILVIEDDEAMSDLLVTELREEGYTDLYVESRGDEAVSTLDRLRPELVICDLRLPGLDGLGVLEAARSMEPAPGFLMITAFGTIRQAVTALKAGADDFLTKPLDFDHLHLAVERILERKRLETELARARAALSETGFHGILGHAPPMRRLFEEIRQVAQASGPVLVTGESGVGKELVARALHDEGPAADGPMISVNCAGIPQELLEAEFFGHASGAFTGAASAREGFFVAADGGTLFLDEVGEMPAGLQAKLLRALDEGEIRPVGRDSTVSVDVRLVAATNRDLREEVRAGRFREDLYYRLETFELRVPSLRERREDLDLLAGRFLDEFALQMGRRVESISEAALAMLHGYDFPGNVRELRNALERAVTFCHRRVIEVEHLPRKIRETARESRRSPDREVAPSRSRFTPVEPAEDLPSLRDVEQRYMLHVLEQCDGNKRRAAAILGIGRRTLYRRLEALALDRPVDAASGVSDRGTGPL